MAMPPIMEKLLKLEKKVDVLEAYRYMRIGSIVDVTAPDLPLENCMWADGSLALFDLWPELKAKYENGGFSGLLLPYNCSDADKAAYPLKWVPDSPNPSGLFVPRLTGLFARYCGGGEGSSDDQCGRFTPAGVPNIRGDNDIGGYSSKNVNVPPTSAIYGVMITAGNGKTCQLIAAADFEQQTTQIDASRMGTVYGKSTTVVPDTVDSPVALYLGRAAQI